MFDRFNGPARRALLLAFREAHRCQHDFIGTEHVLFGLLCDSSGAVAVLLRSLGATPESVLGRVQELMFDDETTVALERFPLSPAVRRAFEYASDEARQLGHAFIGPGHLLLGLLHEGDGEAALILGDFGVSLPSARRELGLLPVADMPDHAVQRESRVVGASLSSSEAEPTVQALEQYVAPGVVTAPTEVTVGNTHPGTLATRRAEDVERQLRITQLLLGGVLGFGAGYSIGGMNSGALFTLGGLAVAAMRSSLLGAIIGFVGGLVVLPLATRLDFDDGWEGSPILLAMLGAALGSFLGDFWRRSAHAAPPSPIEPRN